MNGGGGRVRQTGHCGRAAKGIDNEISHGLHGLEYATIAQTKQALLCDIRDCDNRSERLDGRMDLQQIDEWARAKRGRIGELASYLGLDPDKVSKALSGKRKFTVVEMDKARELVRNSLGLNISEVRSIPLLGSVPAGSWREAVRNSRGTVPVADDGTPPNAYALIADGDSMDRVAPDGSTIIVDPDDLDLYPGRYYVVRNGDGDATFKQFKMDPARLAPCSTNSDHQDILLGRDKFQIVGRVVAVYSRL
jgi:SOS-response transcriptional repressor LexA